MQLSHEFVAGLVAGASRRLLSLALIVSIGRVD